jgi:hypothetical protein
MAVTITGDDLQYILNAIKTESQSVDELPTVNSLSGINSLPALRGQTVVKVPVSLLGQAGADSEEMEILLTEEDGSCDVVLMSFKDATYYPYYGADADDMIGEWDV